MNHSHVSSSQQPGTSEPITGGEAKSEQLLSPAADAAWLAGWLAGSQLAGCWQAGCLGDCRGFPTLVYEALGRCVTWTWLLLLLRQHDGSGAQAEGLGLVAKRCHAKGMTRPDDIVKHMCCKGIALFRAATFDEVERVMIRMYCRLQSPR